MAVKLVYAAAARMVWKRKARVMVAIMAPMAVAAAVTLGPAGCSKHDGDDEAPAAPAPEPEWVPPHRHDAGVDAGEMVDSGQDASDGRAEHEMDLLLDAGRFCGSREQHDCPLQGWMKHNATPILEFGDIGALGVVFDQIAELIPPETKPDGGPVYENWKSIALDGANSSRVGDIQAARAACRGCHTQYRASYHAVLRARGLPPLASVLPSSP